MEFDNVIVKDEDAITWITLNSPERRNALSLELMKELTEAVRGATGAVVVLRGAGPCFSSGHDLSEMSGRSAEFYRELFDECTVLMDAVQGAPQPVIAQVHGVAAAAGCQLVAACDLAVAAEGTRFALTGVNIGLFCSTPMVPVSRSIGRKRALKMLLTGEFVDASTAADWGLVNDVVPAADLDTEVGALAVRIAGFSASTLALGKAAFYRQADLDQRQAYDLTKNVMALNALSEDAQEGIGAFLAKRAPNWKN